MHAPTNSPEKTKACGWVYRVAKQICLPMNHLLKFTDTMQLKVNIL